MRNHFASANHFASVFAAAVLVFLFLPGGAISSQQAPNDANPPAAQAQRGPLTFEQLAPSVLATLHQVDQMNIQAGQLAQSHSQNFQVRELGQRLMMDATLFEQRVNQLAKLSSAPVPSTVPQNPDEQEQARVTSATLQELQNLHGPAFDLMFLQLIQKDHSYAITQLAAADQKLPQSRLRVVVYRLIPLLAQQYEIAATLNLRLAANGIAGGY